MLLYRPLLLVFAPLVLAKDVIHHWNITYVHTNRGLPEPPKRGIGVNGQLPLPVVHAALGDTLILNVHNSLDVPTSLHAHGILQNNTSYYDGVGMVTECGIAPGSNFIYKILLDQAGTHWIHGHSQEQSHEGLRTPLIVHDPNEPYKYDDEFVFAVEEWESQTIAESIDVMTAPNRAILPMDSSMRLLVNGADGMKLKPMHFVPGKVYRIRLIGMIGMPLVDFFIDNHDMEVIEVDGVRSKPKKVNVVRLVSGQRYSVLVRAKNTATMNFAYHLNMIQGYIPPAADFRPMMGNGTVVYSDSAPIMPTTSIPSEPFDDMDLEPLEDSPMLVPDRSLYFNASFGFTAQNTSFESFNLVSFQTPHVPTILTAMTMGDMVLNPI
ncbi:ferroxidase fet3, partial [Linderina macrospora]